MGPISILRVPLKQSEVLLLVVQRHAFRIPRDKQFWASTVIHHLKALLFVACLCCVSIPGGQAATWPEHEVAGFRAFDTGDYLGAVEQFEAALIFAYEEQASPRDLGAILENLATVYFAVGRHQDAWASIQRWDKILAQSANEPWVPEQQIVRDPLARLIIGARDKTQSRTEPSRDAELAAVATVAPPTPGDYAIHLESAGIESNVQSSWDQLKATYPAQFADKSLLVRQVDLGDRGIFYRILAAPYGDSADAGNVCRELEAFGQYCAVYSLE